MPTLKQIEPILEKAKQAAVDYYNLTGKALGITGEMGEYLAAKYLGLELAEARTPGYDAIAPDGKRVEIKSCAKPKDKRFLGMIGRISLKHKFDTVVLVLMNREDFEPFAMYEANWGAVVKALKAPGSKARNERGALSIPKFRSIGEQVWPVS